MENNASTILAIFVAVALMFGFPLITMARKTDKAAQMVVEVATDEYVDSIRVKGMLNQEDYETYIQKISSTGNSFDVEFELQVLDENASKKATFLDKTSVQNKNAYTTYYTTQVMKMIQDNDGVLLLKEGDIITVRAKSDNNTIFQQLTKYVGNNSYAGSIFAYSSGIVTCEGY